MRVNRGTNQISREETLPVRAGDVTLEGDLVVPSGATGIVLFAHGSGSSRHSSRNRFVGQALQEAGLATLLIDLLTAEEEAVDLRTSELRFDLGLLADRLIGGTDWIYHNQQIADLPMGYFGASTGGADGCGRAPGNRAGSGITGRAARPGMGSARPRAGADIVDRWRGR